MMSDFVDLTDKKLFVRLGNEDQTIPICGRGTMRMQVDGHNVAYSDVLYVPDLTAILLSSRVHRRTAPGCSFVADHDGCFLTFPDFTIEIQDEHDCTIHCTAIPDTAPLDFDSRLYLTGHSSRNAARLATTLQLQGMHRARFAGLRKTQAHLDPSLLSDPSPDPATDPATQSTVPDKTSLVTSHLSDAPIRPVYSVPNSSAKPIERISSYELKKLFGCRSLKNWKTLESIGTSLHVVHESDPPLTIGDMATIPRNNHGKLLRHPSKALHTVGMDIGYGEGTSPGGFKYALTLVDLATRHTWVYGLKTKSAPSIIDALWSFFIDAGGIPVRIRCDFDSSFVKGKVYSFLRQRGIRVGASPPGQQSQNGAVERQWRTVVSMTRALLVEARMPRRYWFWALREAVIRMNLLPCRPTTPGTDTDPELGEFTEFPDLPPAAARRGCTLRFDTNTAEPTPPVKPAPSALRCPDSTSNLTTPFELYYGIRPDYRTHFRWGCMGYYRRVRDSSGARGQFDLQSSIGIAIGRSNHTNGMIFWDPSPSG
jgi:transposase InsO family protein